MAPLLIDYQDGIAFLTFNEPDSRNALSMEMRRALFAAVDDVATDDAVRCVVMRGAGGAFMAGGDIRTFEKALAMDEAERQEHFRDRLTAINRMIETVMTMPKPVIASISGPAAGAGMSLALACDIAIADDTATFHSAYRHVALSPDAGGSWLLTRLVGARRAMQLALLGEKLTAAEALQLGLVNKVVPAADLGTETDRLARALADGPTKALAATRRLINAAQGNDLPTHLAAEASAFAPLTITDDWAEAVTAFKAKRKPVFKGQ